MSEKDTPAQLPKLLPPEVDKAFEVLFQHIYSFKPFFEAEAAAQRITEANFWFNQTIVAMQRFEQYAAQQKAQQQTKVVVPGGKA